MNLKSTVIGSTLLVVLLTAGAAQSLSGSNTVTSDDIVDRTIVANDIKTAAIGGRPIVDNSITGADVNESTLALPEVLSTSVSRSGSKFFGSGTPSQVDAGRYRVNYGRSLANCTAQVTPGYNFGTSAAQYYHYYLSATAFIGLATNSVDVVMHDNANALTDSSFFLTVICP